MEYSRTTAGSSKQATGTVETPEQLLDVFKAAALSVTKLYKTSAQAESRARADGYQDCLEDLLGFLDKENMGLCDGEGWGVRRWATERLDGRDSALQSTESEDETDKAAERTASPEVTRRSAEPQQIPTQSNAESPAPSAQPRVDEPTHFVVPSQDTFTFQSVHPYPNIGTLDLSDARPHHDTPVFPTRAAKARLNGPVSGRTMRTSGHLGRGAGSKRRINFDDFFGGCFGGKDPLNPGGKRGRHA